MQNKLSLNLLTFVFNSGIIFKQHFDEAFKLEQYISKAKFYLLKNLLNAGIV